MKVVRFQSRLDYYYCLKQKSIRMRKVCQIYIFLHFLVVLALSIESGIGLTPPMGWTSKAFSCQINQTFIQQTSQKLISSGLAVKGYRYVNLIDCWQGRRDGITGRINENLIKFPSGFNALSGQLLNKGLKLGLGSDLGERTCSNNSGSFNFQKQDALTYSKWQVDFLEYTNCNNIVNPKLRFYSMSKYLNETGRSVFYSIDNQGSDRVWQWAPSMANSWTTVGNYEETWAGLIEALERQVGLQKYSGAGSWNNPGMLMVGSSKLTYNQKYAQFALWCALKAPLMIGADIRDLSQADLQIVSNQELIAINQDSLGLQARRIKSQVGQQFKRQVWGGPLSNNNYIIIFLNRGETQTTIQVSLKNDVFLQLSSYSQRDPIRHLNFGISSKDIVSQKVAAHSVQVRIISILKQPHLMFQ